MNAEQAVFVSFLEELGLADIPAVFSSFEEYHNLLQEYNQGVNLISRATEPEQYWTKHFLDSLLPFKCLDFTGQKVLDFGSGGGLPGIPLKLANPQVSITLLDSITKKTRILDEMVQQLQLVDVTVVNARLEDYAKTDARFDLILCRALRMEDRYRQPLFRLLAPGGRVIFYKAQDSSDLDGYSPKLLYTQSFDWGSRKIVELKRKSLQKLSQMERKWGK